MEAVSIRTDSGKAPHYLKITTTPPPLVIQIFLRQSSDLLNQSVRLNPLEALNTALHNVTDHTNHWKLLADVCPQKEVIELAQYIFKTIYSAQKPLKPFEHLSLKNGIELTFEQQRTVYWANQFLESQHTDRTSSCFHAGFEKLFLGLWKDAPNPSLFRIKEEHYFLKAIIQFSTTPSVEGFRTIAKKLYDINNTLPLAEIGWNEFHWAVFLAKEIEDLETLLIDHPEWINTCANTPQKNKDLGIPKTPLLIAMCLNNKTLATWIQKKLLKENQKYLKQLTEGLFSHPHPCTRFHPDDLPLPLPRPKSALPIIIIITAVLIVCFTSIIYYIIRDIYHYRNSQLKT